MKEIETRTDIYAVVISFYSRLKTDETLGPLFLRSIADSEWEDHMQKITDFWDSAIFNSMTYKGNPANVHVDVDKTNGYDIYQKHFEIWLQNWNETLDANWSGIVAENMKMRARKMSTGLYISMWNNKPEHKKPQ